MSTRIRHRLLLRAYPRSWRERYGEELDELLVRSSGGRRPGIGAALDVLGAGSLERIRAAGLVGDTRPPGERALARVLLVLCAWAVFVVAGVAVQRGSEHWRGGGRTAAVAFDLLVDAAIAGSALVLLGVALALPAFTLLLRSARGRALRRPLLRAAVLAVVALAGLVLVVFWGHRLGSHARNGGDASYGAAVLAAGALGVLAHAAWTAAAVQAARRLSLGPRLLRAEAVVASLVATCMTTMLVATATWWLARSGSAVWLAPLALMAPASALALAGAIGALRASG